MKEQIGSPGQIVLLNGAPRSGKSSIAAAIQATFEGVWMNLGVDLWMKATPPPYLPGLGLRPGGERPDLEPLVGAQYRALYDSIAAHCRLGLNVVADVGHYSPSLFADCRARLEGLPVLWVGVRCPLEIILERRRQTGYPWRTESGAVPPPVLRWQEEVHRVAPYDLEMDTSLLKPAECAEEILRVLTESQTQ
ncbi:chloramphenicol phosphotransferase CPT family protein [soil metagenome]